MGKSIADAFTEAAYDAGEAARDSAVTITARLPIFAGILVAPTAAAIEEWNQACSEKVAATMEGTLAALTEWNAMMMASLFAPMTPMGFASGTMRVLAEASRPAHVAVRANARRLSNNG